ncbi:MAG: hypothetical protein HC800_19770 [Phormidesmis sp. RL_2_1]|nr:hypothetical protein [Phormidesmis sp. RL_2_1]
MNIAHLLSAACLTWGACAIAASAMPEIASGDGLVNAGVEGCLERADTFINSLAVSVERGPMDRTGYFNDGSFRILCYPSPYDLENQGSLVVVFVAHESDFAVADTFVQITLGEIADRTDR